MIASEQMVLVLPFLLLAATQRAIQNDGASAPRMSCTSPRADEWLMSVLLVVLALFPFDQAGTDRSGEHSFL